VLVSPIFWQRNLNLCVSARSSSESRRPLDVISVCTRPGQHVTDCLGEYQPQVTGEEFGLGVRWRLALTSIRVPGPSLGNPPVVVFSLGLGGVPEGGPVAEQHSLHLRPLGASPRLFRDCRFSTSHPQHVCHRVSDSLWCPTSPGGSLLQHHGYHC